MNIPVRLKLAAVLIAPFFGSCASSPSLVSKDKIVTQNVSFAAAGDTRGSFSMETPTASLLAAAASKPKDKHSMPIYTYGERNRVVRTTAYTCSEDDHVQYGSKNAAGTDLRYSDRVRSAAADWSFYPVGTVFRVKGMPQLYVIDDYGSALTGTGTIDMYQPSRDLMNKWGRRNVEISIVRWGSFTRSAELLSGRTKFDHCRQMLANIDRQQKQSGAVAAR